MQDTEYWIETDDELDGDIQDCTPLAGDECHMLSQDQGLDKEQEAVVWWLVIFTCMFQCLHSLSSRAMQWLLKLLSILLTTLGHYSVKVSEIAKAFPSSLHQRARYIKDRVPTPSIILKVVCSTCHTIFDYAECCERQGTTTVIRYCPKHKRQRKTPLLRCVVTRKGTTKYYPIRVYPYCSLISTLRCMLL